MKVSLDSISSGIELVRSQEKIHTSFSSQLCKIISRIWGDKKSRLLQQEIPEAPTSFAPSIDELMSPEYLQQVQACLQSELRESPQKNRVQEVAKKFFKAIAKNGSKVFQHHEISRDLQNILSPELAQLREQKTDRTLACSISHRAQRKIAKAKLAMELGIEPACNDQGLTGSSICLSSSGKKIGLFKDLLTCGHSFRMKIQNFFRKIVGLRGQVSICRNHGTIPALYAEVSASIVDQFFQINLTPVTKTVELGNKKGSFMVWANGHCEASKITFHPAPTSDELFLFQRMAIFDYLIGNLDRHLGNWLVKQEYGHIVSLATIDNANAFIEENPREGWCDYFVRRNQYLWKKIPYAAHPFDERARAIMNLMTPRMIELLLLKLERELPDSPMRQRFLSPQMRSHLYERASVLLAMSKIKKATPLQLSPLYSDQSIQTYLKVT